MGVHAARERTTLRVVLEGGLRPVPGGAWIPDTCRQRDDPRSPCAGAAACWRCSPPARRPPGARRLGHPEARFFPDRRLPRTILRLEAASDRVDGRVVALYSAALRTDVPARSALRLPETTWGLDRLRVTLAPDDVVRVDLSERR